MLHAVNNLQDYLNYEGCVNKQFKNNGMGKIGTTGFLIGLFGGIHFGVFFTLVILSISSEKYSVTGKIIMLWCLYVVFLCSFHFMEFFSTAVNQPTNLAYESYIVNHSTSYTVAALASWVEFWIESALFGENKIRQYVVILGIFLTLGGQILRTVAMWQCGEHFSHVIMDNRADRHKLVTTGVYRYLRHPSYVGWFYWSVGTQLVLCNPLCALLYSYAAWTFFKSRIPYEEDVLLRCYKQEYVNYARTTVLGIPLISSPAADAAVSDTLSGPTVADGKGH